MAASSLGENRSNLVKAVDWLRRVGFRVDEGVRYATTFNKGIWLEGDLEIVYDPEEAHAGDLLHDVGHLATLPSCIRRYVRPGDIEEFVRGPIRSYFESHPNAMAHPEDPVARACLQAGDSEAIAWSYAAAKAAGLDPWITCEKGFSDPDDADKVLYGLKRGAYLGINGLRASGFIESIGDYPELKMWMQP